jgi:cytoskeletal protein CcmA (bactofilin family)
MFFKRKTTAEPSKIAAIEPSYIGRDTSIEGNIICDGEIHIDGAVRGTVRAQTCLIEAHGEIHGDISAQVIYIRGRVIGPVVGTHVHIQGGAHVEGNVTNETLSIENGAYVYGSIRHTNIMAPTPIAPQQSLEPFLNVVPVATAAPQPNAIDSSDKVTSLKTGPRSAG